MSISLNHFRFSVSSQQALYQQIQENIIALIESGLLKTGDALPAERQLSEAYGVTRMTLRRAVDELVQKGVLERRQGAGTFVTANHSVQSFTPTVTGFSQRMREAGMRPTSRLLHRAVIKPDPLVAARLTLKASDEVVMLKRLRLVNDEPLMIETSYLSYALFPRLMQIDLENESLYRVLQDEYGMRVVKAEHTLEPTLLNTYEAHHLGLEINQPAMLVRVVGYSVDHIPIEISKAIVRGDRCRYYFRVETQMPVTE